MEWIGVDLRGFGWSEWILVADILGGTVAEGELLLR